MNVLLHIENLAPSATEEELKSLFMQIGEAIANRMNRDRIDGEPQDYPHTIIDRFQAYTFNGLTWRVHLKIPGPQSNSRSSIFEP